MSVAVDTLADRFIRCSPDFKVRAYRDGLGAPLFLEADFEYRHQDLVDILSDLEERGWEAVPEEEEEPVVLDNGVRIRFRRKVPKARSKFIPGLLSIPALVGLGALAPTLNHQLEMMLGVVAG